MSDIFPNIVFKKTKKRIKKTYIRRSNSKDDDLNNDDFMPLSQKSDPIEESVNQFIAHLNDKNIVNNDLLAREIKDVTLNKKNECKNDVDMSHRYYNNRRTMLISTNNNMDDNNDEEKYNEEKTHTHKHIMDPFENDIVDDDTTLVVNVPKHKPRGRDLSFLTSNDDNIKYQQDYDFLINNNLPLYSQLLNLINAINEDNGFKQYIIKWNLVQLIHTYQDHCDMLKKEVKYLTMMLIIKLEVSSLEDDILTQPLSKILTKLIPLSIGDRFELSNLNHSKKLTRRNTLNFVEYNRLNQVTCHNLAVKLWSQYYTQLPNIISEIPKLIEFEQSPIKKVDIISEEYNINTLDLICNQIMTFSSLVIDDMELNKIIFSWYMDVYNAYIYNDQRFIMSFILLTNDNQTLIRHVPTVKINGIISGVINGLSLTKRENSSLVQLQICQLALCLNLVEFINNEIEIDEWDTLVTVLCEDYHDENKGDGDYLFYIGMITMNILLISMHSKNPKLIITDSNIKHLLIHQLTIFETITNENQSILSKIDLIKEKFIYCIN